jgi:A/G-specific adenine glycosylase
VKQSERNKFIAFTIEHWFHQHGTDFPWRHNRNPYQVWVAAVMLQQTQIGTVTPYFNRFIQHFPNVKSLANSSLDDVLKQWEGLGYYARARNLHKAAQTIMNDLAGILPQTFEQWKSLPGVGNYTAATIASVAFRESVPVLDSVTIRLNLRLENSHRNPKSSKTVNWLSHRVRCRVELATDAGLFNLGSMELGSTICRAKFPLCVECPLPQYCKAYASGHPERIPTKKPSKPIPHYDIAAALIWRDGQLLITRRPEHKMLGGLWEFPGGKQENGETLEECLKREIREELGVSIEVGDLYQSVKHTYSHFRITLHTFHCRIENGEPRNIGVDDFAWVSPEELNLYAFPRADQKIIESLSSSPLRSRGEQKGGNYTTF